MGDEPREICLVCLKPLPDSVEGEYHPRCAKELFGTSKTPRLEIDEENLHLLGLEMAGRVSLSGVQKKVALELERGTLRVVSEGGGQYILKPQTEDYPDLPENEQLCMRIAREAGLRTAVSGLVRLPRGRLAYLAKRFDRVDGQRLPMEDFCQLAELLPRDKYQGSYEQAGKILKLHSDEWIADGAELFRLVLFSWWVGNNDLHRKNIALLCSEGRYRLSPIYDLVSTRIVGLPDNMALHLGGRNSKIRVEDWLALAARLGLSARATEREIVRIFDAFPKAVHLTFDAPMRSDLRSKLLAHLGGRLEDVVHLRVAAAAAIEKPTKKGRAPLVPLGETALAVGNTIRDALAAAGVEAGGPLTDGLRELDWLARSPGPIFAQDGALGDDEERTARAFLTLGRLNRVANVFAIGEELPGAPSLLRKAAAMDPSPEGKVQGHAGDILYELEIAAALATHELFRLELEDTDIVIHDPSGQRIGIECKRPEEVGTIARNLRRGIEQLTKRGLPGFVVLGLDKAVETGWVLGRDEEASRKEAHTSLAVKVAPLTGNLAAEFPPMPSRGGLAAGSILGAIFTLDVVLAVPDQRGQTLVRPVTVTYVLPNPHHPETAPLPEFLGNCIALGAQRMV